VLILEAASREFSANGYSGTTTRQIAETASVTEKMVFRHFGSKAALFEATLVRPLSDFINSYLDQWENLPPKQRSADLGTLFIEGFFAFVQENRETFLSLLPARARHDDPLTEVAHAASADLAQLLGKVAAVVAAEGRPEVDGELAMAAIAAMIMSLVLYPDWLFARSDERDRDTDLPQVIEMIKYGVARHRCSACGRTEPRRGGAQAGQSQAKR
jgi:AcrR family transcriptional regulator